MQLVFFGMAAVVAGMMMGVRNVRSVREKRGARDEFIPLSALSVDERLAMASATQTCLIGIVAVIIGGLELLASKAAEVIVNG